VREHPTVHPDLRDSILAWYRANGRDLPFRHTSDPYAILVSEAMAQQTQAARAGEAWSRFMTRFPTVGSLASASLADVLRAWQGLGYNRRAVNLQRAAQAIAAASYDGVVFEMEHNPYDIRTLRDCMQYMLDRAQIVKSGSLAPAVAPFVRIPPNGGEMNQFIAKQVLDIGVYGIVWPHVSTVEEARNAVQACRYPRPREAACCAT
jgi:hypothetical protein